MFQPKKQPKPKPSTSTSTSTSTTHPRHHRRTNPRPKPVPTRSHYTTTQRSNSSATTKPQSFLTKLKSLLTPSDNNNSNHGPQTHRVSTQISISPARRDAYKNFLCNRGQKATFNPKKDFELLWSILSEAQHQPHIEDSTHDQHYTVVDNDTKWKWAYNSHSGLHPSFPFFIHPVTGAQQSHFYTRPAPTTPTHVSGLSREELFPHGKLVGIKGVDFDPTNPAFNRHIYHGGMLTYYSHFHLDRTMGWKLYNSSEPEHVLGQSRKNAIDYQLAISEEHIGSINHNTNSSSRRHFGPIATLKMHHVLYPHSKQSQIIKTNPTPIVTRYLVRNDDAIVGSLDDGQQAIASNASNTAIITPAHNNLPPTRDQISELQRDKHDFHLGYKITADMVDRWSKLSGNSNMNTLDQRYAQIEGLPGRMVPIQLLAALALDGLHVVSKGIAPEKPVIVEGMEEIVLETRLEGFKDGFLSHLRSEAQAKGMELPEELSPEELAFVVQEFNQGMDNSLPPWHSVVQTLKTFVFEGIRPIYLPVKNNLSRVGNGLGREKLQGSGQGGINDNFDDDVPTVYLDFYAKVIRDDQNHQSYLDGINAKMNDAMDFVDKLQQEHNPIRDGMTAEEIDAIPVKRLTIVQSTQAMTSVGDQSDPGQSTLNEDKRESFRLQGFQQQIGTSSLHSSPSITTIHTPPKDGSGYIDAFGTPPPRTFSHDWDETNRIYLPSDDILETIVNYHDLLRTKPATIKLWFTVRYDDPLNPNDDDNNNNTQARRNDAQDGDDGRGDNAQPPPGTRWVESLEKCFLAFATFGPAPPTQGYNVMSLQETNHTLAFVQGIEVIQEDGI